MTVVKVQGCWADPDGSSSSENFLGRNLSSKEIFSLYLQFFFSFDCLNENLTCRTAHSATNSDGFSTFLSSGFAPNACTRKRMYINFLITLQKSTSVPSAVRRIFSHRQIG